MLKPLVYLDGSNQFYPTSLTYLQRLLDSGLIWAICGGNFNKQLRNYQGQVFEFYCRKVCERIGNNSRIRHKYFFDKEYDLQSKKKKSCDAIIVFGRTAVMMEFKTKAPNLTHTIIGRSFNQFVQDIKDGFIGGDEGDKAAKQIDNSIRAIRKGELRLPGVDTHSIQYYFPVVVTFEAWPLGPWVYELVRRTVQKAGLLKQAGYVAPLEVWSCQELEFIEAVLDTNVIDLPSLIRNKITHRYNNLRMEDFLSDNYPGQKISSEYVHTKRDELFDIIKDTLSLVK